MKRFRFVQLAFCFTALVLFCGHTSAQLIEKPDKNDKTQKQSLIVTPEDISGKSTLVIDFNNDLKSPRPIDNSGTNGNQDIEMQTSTAYNALPIAFCTTGDISIDSIIRAEARDHNVDPCLIMLVMGAESTYKRNAISPKGAMGLMQLIPETAARFGVKDIFNAKENIHGGTAYLRWLLDYFHGDIQLALAGYNAGEGAVVKYKNTIPPYEETQKYVKIIYGQYVRIFASQRATTKAPQIVAQASPSFKIMVDFNVLQEGHPTDKPSTNSPQK